MYLPLPLTAAEAIFRLKPIKIQTKCIKWNVLFRSTSINILLNFTSIWILRRA